jgi:hypothetical protein
MLRAFFCCWGKITRAWRAAQVELHGEYSTERLLSFRDYCERASTTRCLFILAATPLPCLIVTLLIECIPLRPPSDGIEHSHMLWLRTFAVMLAVEFSMLQQCRCLVPRLPTFDTLVMVATVVGALGCTAGMFGMSYAIGFPLPFTFLAGAPVTVTLMLLSMVVLWGRFLADNYAERLSFVYYFAVIPVQVGLACAYPAYAFIFVHLSAGRQVASMAIIPIVKILTKNVLVKICRGDGDLKPLVVVLNAEIYHVLFFSWCMNSTTSKAAIATLALADVLETMIAFHDINQVLAKIISGSHRLQVPLLQEATTALATSRRIHPSCQQVGSSNVGPSAAATTLLSAKQSVQRWRLPGWFRIVPIGTKALGDTKRSPCLRTILSAQQSTSHAVMPAHESSASVRVSSRSLLDHTRRLLYLTEFVLLVEYMEVITPCLYSKQLCRSRTSILIRF